MIILWRGTTDDKLSRKFKLDENKSWKKGHVKGYDMAEMIAQDIWEREKLILENIFITDPPEYSGEYKIKHAFSPEFTAARVYADGEIQPKKTKRH